MKKITLWALFSGVAIFMALAFLPFSAHAEPPGCSYRYQQIGQDATENIGIAVSSATGGTCDLLPENTTTLTLGNVGSVGDPDEDEWDNRIYVFSGRNGDIIVRVNPHIPEMGILELGGALLSVEQDFENDGTISISNTPLASNYFANDSQPINTHTRRPGITPTPTPDNPDGSVECQTGFMGWLLCQAVLWATDTLNDFVLEPLLQTQPATRLDADGQETVLYRTWSGMLTFANILLVPIFLVIIFSQALSLNIDAYTIKKTLPRIIVATILLQLSFFLASIMLDITNVLGNGIRGLMESAVSTDSIAVSGEGVAGRAGTEIVLLLVALALVGAVMTGALVVPLLIGFFAVLGAFFTLVFRQLLIVLLVIVAPLAILAWVLPNTEKVFKQWWSNFVKVLLMYPLIQLLLGAGVIAAVLANEISGPSPLRSVVALSALIAPLLLIPATFKMAGASMGLIADGMNKVSGGLRGRAIGDPKDPHSFAARQNQKVADKKGSYRGGRRGNTLTQAIVAPVATAKSKIPGRVGSGARGLQAATNQEQLTEMSKKMEDLGIGDTAAYEFIRNYHDRGQLHSRIGELRSSKKPDGTKKEPDQISRDMAVAGQLEALDGLGYTGDDAAAGAAMIRMFSQGFRSREDHQTASKIIRSRVQSPTLQSQVLLNGALKAREAGRFDVFADHHPKGEPLNLHEMAEQMTGEDWRKAKPQVVQAMIMDDQRRVQTDVLTSIVKPRMETTETGETVFKYDVYAAEALGGILSPANANAYSPDFRNKVNEAIEETFSDYPEVMETINKLRNWQPPAPGGGADPNP